MNYSGNIKALNPRDALCAKTEYYSWLKENYSGNRIEDLKDYLAHKGFTIGEDTLDGKVIQTLGYIHDHFFYTEVLTDD